MASRGVSENSGPEAVLVRAMRRDDVPAVHRMIHVSGTLGAARGRHVHTLCAVGPDGLVGHYDNDSAEAVLISSACFEQELATFEGVPDGPRLSVQELMEDGFDCSPPWFFGLVAERSGRAVGYALCNRAYSSWTRKAFYVEDLYVQPSERRGGVATSLLRALCQLAVEADVHRIDWHVLADNANALRFYRRLGARDLALSEGRAALRLDRDRVEAVAAGHLLAPIEHQVVTE